MRDTRAQMSEPNLDLGATPPPADEPSEVGAERPAADAALTLEAPAPVPAVAVSQAEATVKLDPEQQRRIDDMVQAYLDAVTRMDSHEPAFTARVNDINKLGDEDIRAAANVSNRLLDKPIANKSQSGVSP